MRKASALSDGIGFAVRYVRAKLAVGSTICVYVSEARVYNPVYGRDTCVYVIYTSYLWAKRGRYECAKAPRLSNRPIDGILPKNSATLI